MANIVGDRNLGAAYTNPTQIARAVSEGWFAGNGYCLSCNSNELSRTSANTRACDFTCPKCNHRYELKSKRGIFGSSIVDGAYSAMIKTIREGRTPTLLLMEYSTSWSISGLRAIHHSLITETAIRPRNPLAPTARRAGWIGCNIALTSIAIDGQIPIIANGMAQQKTGVRESFARLENFSTLPSEERTWAATVLQMVGRFRGGAFSLHEVYAFEFEIQRLFPNNKNIKPKIRQQLQFLRDAGLIVFRGGGKYEHIGTTL